MTNFKEFFISEKKHPKKSLGQNFIIDQRVLDRIGEIAGLSEEDEVLEIGAGLGALTLFLGKKVKRVVAIEKDIRLLEELKSTVSDLGNVEIIPGDALQVDFRGFYRDKKIKVVSNLPYSVSSPILVKLIEEREIFSLFVLMLQREVGERITASPGGKEYGSISVLVQAYTDASVELRVSPAAFWPQPKVDSVVVKLMPLPSPRIRLRNEKLFRKIIRAAFSSRRKIISNSLGSQFPKEKVEEILLRSGIDKKRRAETLSVEEFGRVTEEAVEAGLS
ncbi:MAG TPA: 16S rRNA (adenine(1518)-N(6)/adenine(1519)-N(6))-dimethyltransferase RsmA [Thermodesulfobacteriota bacterium]|nr:16S rRNA (adenine(1518)-N(6)/adenine(1519)-N(6))-dimethyltransferase RsmA [Thermodesulfobacteriota bacterium]